MSTSTTGAISTFNKSKEDFIWWVKKAMSDKKSYSYSELYHSLLKMFAEADTNNDGLVSKESFSKLVDAAGALPRAYGFAPQDSDLYKTEKDKEDARQKMFDSMDKKSTGVITFDEWLAYCMEHIMAKTATLAPHVSMVRIFILFLQHFIQPIIDHGTVEEYKTFIKAAVTNVTGPENVELYWFMLELFTDHDTTKCGRVNISQFTPMMSELVKTPKKHGLSTPAEVNCCDFLFLVKLSLLFRGSTRLSSRSTTPGVTATSPLMSGSSSLPRRSSRPLSDLNVLPLHDLIYHCM